MSNMGSIESYLEESLSKLRVPGIPNIGYPMSKSNKYNKLDSSGSAIFSLVYDLNLLMRYLMNVLFPLFWGPITTKDSYLSVILSCVLSFQDLSTLSKAS